MAVSEIGPRPSLLSRFLRTGFGLIVLCVAAMWAIEILDTVLLGDRLQRNGIHPRRVDGLDGILWAPLLHSDFGHVASNSVPFLVMGWLTALRGRGYWLAITLASAIFGGGLVWLLAGGSNHIGASGVVFGYFGALMGAALKSRTPAMLAPAMVAIFLYGTILVGIVPQDDISWEGHLFGLLAGGVVAYRMVDPPRSKDEEDEIMYPWELDEPWRTDRGESGA
ncbi:MAG: rhomboid family intramembrane serine protease [Actinomycetota bacterium]